MLVVPPSARLRLRTDALSYRHTPAIVSSESCSPNNTAVHTGIRYIYSDCQSSIRQFYLLGTVIFLIVSSSQWEVASWSLRVLRCEVIVTDIRATFLLAPEPAANMWGLQRSCLPPLLLWLQKEGTRHNGHQHPSLQAACLHWGWHVGGECEFVIVWGKSDRVHDYKKSTTSFLHCSLVNCIPRVLPLHFYKIKVFVSANPEH